MHTYILIDTYSFLFQNRNLEAFRVYSGKLHGHTWSPTGIRGRRFLLTSIPLGHFIALVQQFDAAFLSISCGHLSLSVTPKELLLYGGTS